MRKRDLILLAGLLLSALFLWLALRDAELDAIVGVLRQSRWVFAVPLLGALAVYFWLKAWRWQLLLRPVSRCPISDLLPATVIGYMGNILLPLYLGELARIEVVKRQHGLPRTAVLATLVLERAFDILTILCLIALALLTSAHVPEYLRTAGQALAVVFACLVLGLVLLALFPERAISLSRVLTGALPTRIGAGITTYLESVANGLASIRSPGLMASITLASVLQWLFMGVCVYAGILAVGTVVPISAAFLVLVLSVIGMTLPSSPGFIGTIQLAFTLGLEGYGVGPNEALGASIFYHVLVNASIVIAGLVFLRHLGARLAELGRDTG